MQSIGTNSMTAACGRAEERVKLHRRAELVLHAGQMPVEVTLEDVSVGGAGLVSAIDMPHGAAATLMLHTASPAPRSILGHIRNSKPIENDQFRISLQFDTSSGPAIKRIRYAFFPDDALSG